MPKYSFDELKMIYDSTERVTDRRLSNNKANYSICVATLIAIAIIWKWVSENNNYFFGGLLLILVLSSLVVVFCSLWIGQIRDFKNLNTCKYEVINEMSKNLHFDSATQGIHLESYQPFLKEWEKISKLKGLQEHSKGNIIALRSTNTEYFLPKAFRLIFALVAVISFITILINPDKTWNGIKFLLQIN